MRKIVGKQCFISGMSGVVTDIKSFLGIKDHTIVKYVFRNAMLPQITGLAKIGRAHV